MTEFRPLRRIKQTASQEECIALLESAPRGVLAVHGENGYPYGIPVNYVFLDGKVYFHCAKEGHKVDALRADDRVSFTILSEPVKNEGEWWYCFTSVIVFGRISEIAAPDKADRILRALGSKYFPEGYDMETDIIRNGPRALILELTIDHVSGKHVREK